jgi:hypothetical protein
MPFDVIRGSSPEALWNLLGQGGGLRYPRAVMLAELLLQDAELAKSENRPADVLRSEVQAFCLLSECLPVLSHDDAAVYRPKVEALARELERTFGGEPYVQEKLRRYRSGQS